MANSIQFEDVVSKKNHGNEAKLHTINRITKEMKALNLEDGNIINRLLRKCDNDLSTKRLQYVFFCESSNKAYCSVCILFASRKYTTPLTSKGLEIKSYTNASTLLRNHEGSAMHRQAYDSYTEALTQNAAFATTDSSVNLMDERISDIAVDTENEGQNAPIPPLLDSLGARLSASTENDGPPLNPMTKLIDKHLSNIVNDAGSEGQNAFRLSQDQVQQYRHVLERIIMCIIFLVTNGKF